MSTTQPSDTLRALLDSRVQNIKKYIDQLNGDRDRAQRLIDNTVPVLGQAERDLNEALAAIGILFGQTAPLAPRDIRSEEHVLGLQVGPLKMGPPNYDVPSRDLDFYRATMRALADQANHQARLVGDELARREQAATEQTTAFPQVPPADATRPDATQVIPAVTHPHHPYADFVGRTVEIDLDDSTGCTGVFTLDDSGQNFMIGRKRLRPITAIRHIKTVEPPASVDPVMATPAQQDGQVTEP